MGATPDDLLRIPDADFNICLYPEIALTTCTWLQRSFAQPTIKTVPIGVGATRDFIAEIGKIAEIMGYTHKDIMDGKIKYNFDSQRKLSFAVDSMDTAKKDEINAALEADPDIDTVKSTTRIKAIVAK